MTITRRLAGTDRPPRWCRLVKSAPLMLLFWALVLLLLQSNSRGTAFSGWSVPSRQRRRRLGQATYRIDASLQQQQQQQLLKLGRRYNYPATACFMNLLDDLWTGTMGNENNNDNVPAPLPYGNPLLLISTDTVTLAIQERGISFTGEDFDVMMIPSGTLVCKVRGAMLHLPGKDKMRLLNINGNGKSTVAAVLDRKLVALTPTYDLFRGDGVEKIGWIEKVAVAFRDCFEVHLESTPHLLGPIKGPAAYKLTGDFLDRTFVMKDTGRNDATVAVVSKTGWFPQFDAMNHYQVQVAPGMDFGLVVACVSAIDEEFDEEHQKKKLEQEQKKKESGGGWFGL